MSARSFLRGLRSRSSRCTSCGSDATYPFPGRLRLLARLAGLERYSCRACRRRFWLPLGADGHHTHLAAVTPASPVITRPPVRASDLVAIDAAVALPKPGGVTAGEGKREGKRRRRRRR